VVRREDARPSDCDRPQVASSERYSGSTVMHRDTWFMGFIVLLAAVLPWIAAIVWVASRAGWSSVFSQEEGAFPSQASQVRGFGGGPNK
jgi:cytoskeletal protein RodZ